jgi:hypothetical protein
MRSTTWTIVAIAALGLVLAVALGIFADTIARGTVALPSTNLTRTSTQLAPDQAAARLATTPVPKKTKAKKRTTTTGTTTAAAPTTTAEAGDDHGGRGRGRGSDDSSGGSSHSGKGGDD